ncbi:hypothetical protein Enr13x_07590 [Stieleria neptunia]|uniref:Uncharacterized protein n=1 Tax=Stieleria neptunia TaxID=2527979 RepID=A0A518HJB4_9BACT|nr:hypothetical protein [Stieleria neptunia]QDV40921.1 hypothetical protein Enr13x_07590 [Stieleria neptunia]
MWNQSKLTLIAMLTLFTAQCVSFSTTRADQPLETLNQDWEVTIWRICYKAGGEDPEVIGHQDHTFTVSASDETDAIELAADQCEALPAMICAFSASCCGYAAGEECDGYEPDPNPVDPEMSIKARQGGIEDESEPRLYEVRGIGKKTNAVVVGYSTDSLDHAWLRFRKGAARQNGLIAGSLKVRDVRRWVYVSRVFVKSRFKKKVYSEEAYCVGDSVEKAQQAAERLAIELELHLMHKGHTVLETRHTDPAKKYNSFQNTCGPPFRGTAKCKVRTDLGIRNVKVVRLGHNQLLADYAAATALLELADAYGGCIEGTAPVVPKLNVVVPGCSSCSGGSDAAKGPDQKEEVAEAQ